MPLYSDIDSESKSVSLPAYPMITCDVGEFAFKKKLMEYFGGVWCFSKISSAIICCLVIVIKMIRQSMCAPSRFFTILV